MESEANDFLHLIQSLQFQKSCNNDVLRADSERKYLTLTNLMSQKWYIYCNYYVKNKVVILKCPTF